LQRLQISSQSIGDNVKNLRRNKGEVLGLEVGWGGGYLKINLMSLKKYKNKNILEA
jgi:uncharacterized protein YcsI (UPF0317 family)